MLINKIRHFTFQFCAHRWSIRTVTRTNLGDIAVKPPHFKCSNGCVYDCMCDCKCVCVTLHAYIAFTCVQPLHEGSLYSLHSYIQSFFNVLKLGCLSAL